MHPSLKTVLVASDLSERSDLAVARAGAIAAAGGARLIALMVIDEELPETLRAATAEASADLLQQQMDRLGVTGEVRIEIGDPPQDIHRVADEISADLLVLGLHRLRPLMDLFSGATMERVVRASERPVLLAHSPIKPGDSGAFTRALIGVDLSPACGAAVRATARIAPDAEIVSFYAYHAPFKGYRGDTLGKGYQMDAEREVDRWLETTELPEGYGRPMVLEGSVYEIMDRLNHEIDPDLIAVGAHGRSSLAPTLLGSYTEELMRRPPCDLLVVRR